MFPNLKTRLNIWLFARRLDLKIAKNRFRDFSPLPPWRSLPQFPVDQCYGFAIARLSLIQQPL